MSDTNFTGMDPKSAREYLYNYLVSLKREERAMEELSRELEKWKSRVELAVSKGDEELAGKARERVVEIEERLSRMKADTEEMRLKASVMKDNLRMLYHNTEPSVDAEKLLAEMELIVGKKDSLSDEIKKMEADDILKKLKEKYGEGNKKEQ